MPAWHPPTAHNHGNHQQPHRSQGEDRSFWPLRRRQSLHAACPNWITGKEARNTLTYTGLYESQVSA